MRALDRARQIPDIPDYHDVAQRRGPILLNSRGAQQARVTYWLAPGRRVILMTVFRKTRSAEAAEVARALRAQMICETEHGRAHEVFDREVN